MIELKGKYCKDCKIFADTVDEAAVQTLQKALDDPEYGFSKVRVMPDVHPGKGCVVGFSAEIPKVCAPELLGPDIGCGIDAAFFSGRLDPSQYALFEHRVRKAVPSGFAVNDKRTFDMKAFLKFFRDECESYRQKSGGRVRLHIKTEKDLDAWMERIGINKALFYKSLGTIGGGNHFIEYGEIFERSAVTVHTGSRYLGNAVYKYWMRRIASKTGDVEEWTSDTVMCQIYAKFNRSLILDRIEDILHNFKLERTGDIQTMHNYIDFRDGMIRKGSQSAHTRQLLLVPLNMGAGVAVCEGTGNPDWNFSAPHGTGRRMSRSEAKKTLDINECRKAVENVYMTALPIDEAPGAYKDPDEVIEAMKPACEEMYVIAPKVNIKDTKGDIIDEE